MAAGGQPGVCFRNCRAVVDGLSAAAGEWHGMNGKPMPPLQYIGHRAGVRPRSGTPRRAVGRGGGRRAGGQRGGPRGGLLEGDPEVRSRLEAEKLDEVVDYDASLVHVDASFRRIGLLD